MVATYVKTVILERWFFYSQIGSAFNLSVVTQIKIKTKRWKVDQLLSGRNFTLRQEICKQTAEIIEEGKA